MRHVRAAVGMVWLRAARSGMDTPPRGDASSLWCGRAAAMIALLLVASGGTVLPRAEAQDLFVDSDTTISSAEGYDNTYVAPNGGDTVTLEVTTGGALTNNVDLYVGLGGTGTLNVTGGTVTNSDGYIGFNADSVGMATVSSGTWANSGSLWVGYFDPDIPLDSTGTLTMTGGLVTVSGVLYRGALGTINLNAGGTLQIGTGGAGSGLNVGNLTNNGTLAFNQSDNYTYIDAISGSGAVTKAGTGTLTLSASNGYTGATNVNGGVLALRNTNALAGTGAISFGGGALQYSANNTADYSSRILNSGSAIAIDTNGQSVTFASSLNSSNTGGLTKSGLGTLTLSASNGYTGGTTISSGTLRIGNGGTTGSINGNVVNNATLAFNRSNASIFSDVISGTGGLAISGSGAVTLTGNNTYTGVTTVPRTFTSGSVALQVGNGGTTGSIAGNVLFSGAKSSDYSLVFNRSDDLTYSGTVTGSGVGGMLKLGAGTLTLTGYSNTGSGMKVSEGAVQVGDGGTTGVLINRVVLENNSSIIFNRSDDVTRNAGVSGTGTLIKRGAGTLTLGRTSDYSGGTTISGGALATGTSGALPIGGAVAITSGTLDLRGYSATIGTLSGSSGGTITSGSAGSITLTSTSATNSTYAGTITNGLGTMAFTKQGAGTLTLSGTSSYTGATTISGGVLAYGVSNALSNSTAVTVAGGGLDLGSYTDTVASFTITSGSLFGSGKLTAATYALGGGIVTGNLGGGTMTVTANSALNGTADVTSVSFNAGTLALGSAGRFTSNQVALTGSSGANLSLGGNESVGSLAGGFNVALGSGTLTIGNDNTSTSYSGILSGAGGLTKLGAGTVTLSGSNTYSGGTTVSAGSLVGTTSSLQGAITNNAAVTFNQSTDGTYAGVMSGSGSFTKLGAGAVTLSGANTYSGATTVSAGTLLVNGSLTTSAITVGNGGTLGGSGTLGALVTVQSGGVLSPGNSPGALAAAALDLQAGSTTFMEVIGSGSAAGVAGSDYDQVRITTSGGLTYGGSLDLNFGNSSQFLDGTVFDLFAFTGSPIGHFSSVVSSGTGLYANASFSRIGGTWTSTIGDQLLSFSELTGRLLFTSSGAAVPEIDPATGSSALSLIAGVLAMLEQRRRRATPVASFKWPVDR